MMKTKLLIPLIGAAAGLGLLAYITAPSSHRAGNREAARPLMGVLQDAARLGAVERIVFESPERTVTVARVEGRWCLPARDNYPVDFTRVDGFVSKLAELRGAQPLPTAGTNDLARMGLAAAGEGVGTRVSLQDKDGKNITDIVMGRERMRPGRGASPLDFGGMADGRFVAVEGKPYLIGESFYGLPQGDFDWSDRRIIDVSPSRITAFEITGADGQSIRFARKEKDAAFVMEGLAKEETLDDMKVSSAAGFMQYLTFDEVYGASMTPEKAGVDKPAAVFKARLEDGAAYEIRVGQSPQDAQSRYVKIDATYTPPPAPEAAKDQQPADGEKAKTTPEEMKPETIKANVEKAREELAKWIYLVPADRIANILVSRADFIKKPEPPPAENNPQPAPAAALETPATADTATQP